MNEQEIQKFGVFFGAHHTETRLETLMFTRIKHIPFERLRKQERALTFSKWFDYRFLHPVLATFLFSQAYATGANEMYRRYVDSERAHRFQALKSEDIFALAQVKLTGLWRARQHADALGMPYEIYVELAMERLMRYKRPYLPQPQQLYSDDAVAAARKGWFDRQETRVLVAADERYRNQFYVGLPVQDAHRRWVIEQIKRRMQPQYAIANYVWKDPVITEEMVIAQWGADTLERARSVCA